jgi:flagellin
MSKLDAQRSDTLSRLSTGLRINKAADDASGLSIANGFRAQALGIGQAIQNGTDATSMIQIADGALEESANILNTIRTKAVQASSDGQTTETRRLIQNDIDRLMTQLDNIAQNTSFNGQKLLSGAFTNKSFQIGANANQTFSVSIASTESTKMGHISTAKLSLASPEGGDTQLTVTSSITGEKLTMNTISLQNNNKAENGMGALADEINRYSSTTGISATAVVSSTGQTAIAAGSTGSDFAINGVTVGSISVQSNDSDNALVTGINAKSAETGVTASTTNDGKLTLTSNDGRAIKVTGDLGGVAGATSGQLSTLGHINLVQSGVSDFQISGIGAGATGANITLQAAVSTVEDSVVAAGSTIRAASTLATGTTLGGNAAPSR